MGIRVAVLDRQLTVAELLAARLLEQPGIDETSAHIGPESLYRLLDQGRLDVVLADWRLQSEHPTLIDGILSAGPGVRILVVGNGATPRDVRTAIEAGAAGWVPADVTFDELMFALSSVERGDFWVPGRVAMWAAEASCEATADDSRSLAELTPRERQVLQGMVDGLARAQIADLLGMSPHTVRTHVHSVLHKLGVHSSLRAVAVARRVGLQASDQVLPRQSGIDTESRGRRR